MDIQDRYDELTNIIETLENLKDEISVRDYIEQFTEIIYQAEKDREEVEIKLQKQYDKEEIEIESQYWRDAI